MTKINVKAELTVPLDNVKALKSSLIYRIEEEAKKGVLKDHKDFQDFVEWLVEEIHELFDTEEY